MQRTWITRNEMSICARIKLNIVVTERDSRRIGAQHRTSDTIVMAIVIEACTIGAVLRAGADEVSPVPYSCGKKLNRYDVPC